VELKISINNLSFSYASHSILKDVNLTVDAGEVLSIVGPNGSGKSTLLKCINQLLKTQRNTVLIDGKDVSSINLKELCKIIGYVPQASTSTFPFTVFDVVLMGRRPYIQWSVSRYDNLIVAEILNFMGIKEFAFRHFNELSGGEQQKVIIARALAQQPQILLLDEPTSSLDIRHQMEILCMLRGLTKSKQRSVIMAIHDLNLTSRFSDQIILLKKGKIFAAGTPNAVLTKVNVEAVYGIKCRISYSFLGVPQIIPLESESDRDRTLKLPEPRIKYVENPE